ncbi:MAG: DUF2065 family protein [Alphaproteobacteria bacterium]|nr:DUF2065 family protein [Alphaproteobacteria bacterium]
MAAAIALILVIEGALYALFPTSMKRMLAEVMRMPESMIRNAGMIAAALGLAILYMLYR